MKRFHFPLLALLTVVIASSTTSCSIVPDLKSGIESWRDRSAAAGAWQLPGFEPTGQMENGVASWYEIKCNGGTHTASGETLNNWADTAAHKTLPMGTHVRVKNLSNGIEKVVRINDRGPYIDGRIIDVTIGVAHELDFVNGGVVPVEIEIVEPVGVEESAS
ncbi:MAG: rare lipoprotein A (peptidoglycan hydrolase) [Verrucomicrobiales bacterium]|jgi:rare lipoprotein A (peptidoglycan hydrolase)